MPGFGLGWGLGRARRPLGATSGLVPWTLDDIPVEYRGMLVDMDKPILNDGKVAALSNKWSETLMFSQADPLYQVPAGTSKGFPALLFPKTPNALGLTPTTSFAPVWWLFVADYPTNPFNTPSFILDGGSSNRVFGNTNADGFNEGNSWTSKSNRNAAGYADKLLPLDLSSFQIRGASISAPWCLGRRGTNLQSWQDAIYHIMALNIEPVGDLLARIEGRVHWDFRIQSSLPLGHPFRDAPPMKPT